MDARKRTLIWLVVVVAAFLAGFGWQWVRAEREEAEAEELRLELAMTELEATLGATALAAQYGGYDVALDMASDFFTTLQQNVERAPAEAREELTAILRQRDSVIASLSRGNPESGAVLGRLFVRYRIAMGGPEMALPVAATPPDAM